MQLLDIDYSNLQLKQIGAWPLVLRSVIVMAAILLILISYYIFDANQKVNSIQKNNQAIQDKCHQQLIIQDDLLRLKALVSKDKLLEEHCTLHYAPQIFEMTKFVEKVNEIASGLLLNIVSLHLLETESCRDELSMTVIELRLAANYHQIAELLSILSAVVDNFTIDQLTITQEQANVNLKFYAGDIKKFPEFFFHESNLSYHGKALRNPFVPHNNDALKSNHMTGDIVGNIKSGKRNCLIVKDILGHLKMVANDA